MSIIWDYRFAFRLQGWEDVPTEFRRTYKNVVAAQGKPVWGLFSPSLEEGNFLVGRRTPPCLWLVFGNGLSLLSLHAQSNEVSTWEVPRQDFLGYGLVEFLLDCSFSLYLGSSQGEPVRVRFPSRAWEKYQELAQLLQTWMIDETHPDSAPGQPGQGRRLAGLPPKFTRFIDAYPEIGNVQEEFFQPRLVFSRRRGEEWPNLWLLLTSKAIVVLCDQSPRGWSEYGVEACFFPLASVRSADWVEGTDADRGTVRIHLKAVTRRADVSWIVFSGLKFYVLRWVEALHAALTGRKKLGATGSSSGEAETLPQQKVSLLSCEKH
jgi:hypothetical protein